MRILNVLKTMLQNRDLTTANTKERIQSDSFWIIYGAIQVLRNATEVYGSENISITKV